MTVSNYEEDCWSFISHKRTASNLIAGGRLQPPQLTHFLETNDDLAMNHNMVPREIYSKQGEVAEDAILQ